MASSDDIRRAPKRALPADEAPERLNESGHGDDDSVITTGVGMSEMDIVRYVEACRKEAEQTSDTIRTRWQVFHDQYSMREDLSHKEDWESKIYVPKANQAVKKAVSLMRRILMREGLYFDMTPVGREDRQLADQNKRAVKWAHENMADGKQFLKLALEVVEISFVFGIGFMKLWGENERYQDIEITPVTDDYDQSTGEMAVDRVTKYRWRLAGRAVDPRNLWFDPDMTYFIEEGYYLLSDVLALSEGPNPIYNPAQVKKLKEEDYGEDTDQAERLESLDLKDHSHEFRKRAFLQEYWGDLYNKDGELVKRGCRVVVANKKWVLNLPTDGDSKLMDNPFWHNKPPYLSVSPILVAGRKVGQALIESTATIQEALNHLMRMSLDGMLWRLLKIVQVIGDRLENPADIKKLRPGKPIRIREGQGPAIAEVPISDLPGSAITEKEILDRIYQEGTGVTDFIMGLPRVKGEITATEASLKTQESTAYFEAIAREVESQLIVKGVEMSRQLMVQYWDAVGPHMQEIFGEDVGALSQMPREKRVQFLQTNMDVTARGISSYFEKEESKKILAELIALAGKVPEVSLALDMRAVADRLLHSVVLTDVDRLLVGEDEYKARNEQRQQMQQMDMALKQGLLKAQIDAQKVNSEVDMRGIKVREDQSKLDAEVKVLELMKDKANGQGQ